MVGNDSGMARFQGEKSAFAIGETESCFGFTAAVAFQTMFGEEGLNVRLETRGDLVRTEGENREEETRENQPNECGC